MPPDGIVEDIYLRLRRTSPRASFAPPSPASSGSAISPAFASASSMERPPCWASFTIGSGTTCRRRKTPSRASSPPRDSPDHRWGDSGSDYNALDCRHGRVLLGIMARPCRSSSGTPWQAAKPRWKRPKDRISAAGPRVCVSSPNTGEWSDPCPGLDLGVDAFIMPVPPVVIRDRCSLLDACMRVIDMPLPGAVNVGDVILMAMEDGSLGLAHEDQREKVEP
ncbi:hypothetical protein TRIUR3_15286 [Triticum urartu]|uniref:Uncharacterized protein n=1 Tax=Triticum urartu TaxID=4572 RepID=M8AR89_TRIUA|nr:hypothetical protein TRIUR3_15286 [Triticum urartu]